MRTHVALLRGINVGGRNRLAMADLRRIVAGLGHGEVATYVQSGNVVFAAGDPRTPEALAGELEAALAAQLPVHPAVVVVARPGLAEVIAGNPFPSEPDPRAVHAVFLREAPDPAGVAAVAAALERARARGSRDQAVVAGQAVYLWTPGGMGRSELAVELARGGERATPVAAGTARNWATVTKLAELLDG